MKKKDNQTKRCRINCSSKLSKKSKLVEHNLCMITCRRPSSEEPNRKTIQLLSRTLIRLSLKSVKTFRRLRTLSKVLIHRKLREVTMFQVFRRLVWSSTLDKKGQFYQFLHPKMKSDSAYTQNNNLNKPELRMP